MNALLSKMSRGNNVSGLVVPSDKVNKAQEVFVKNLILRCKSELDEELWQMPEMVGYYNESLPIAPLQATADGDSPTHPMKKVVCSPDLPIAEYPPSSIPLTTPISAAAAQPSATTDSIQCQICHKLYSSKSAFQAHQRTHAKETADDPYRCNICSKTFAVPARLTRHYRTHTGEKPFRCEFCNKSFSVKENLSVHRRIHTKERPYKCEVCARAFEHSGKLHRHMRIHTGERPHKCTICSKTFIQSGQLVIHMRTHTGEKPYVCAVCQKGFTCSKQLKVHSRTHTGEKPYSCDICGKSFGYNHVLKLHQVAHYGEKVYKCTICNDTFNSKKGMEAHIKSHADNAPTTPPASSSSSESSCSSIVSDKENKDLVPVAQEQPYEQDFRYYICPRSPPTGYILPHLTAGVELLAAAATVTESTAPVVLNIISKNPQVTTLRHPAYFPGRLANADDLRRRVEAVIDDMQTEEEPLTPPVSPVTPDPELSLPPRKRSKMILRSMEATIDLSSPSVRYNSVIQYARAS